MQDKKHAALYSRAVMALSASGLVSGKLIAHCGRQGQVKYQLDITGGLEVLVSMLEDLARRAAGKPQQPDEIPCPKGEPSHATN
jgi:hypothetical protein